MAAEAKVSYVEVKADKIFRHFAEGFTPPEGDEFVPYMDTEFFYDPAKGVVLFKLWTRPVKNEIDK